MVRKKSNFKIKDKDIHLILKGIVPQLLVAYNLDDLYIKKEKLAIKKIGDILKKDEPLDVQGGPLIIQNFNGDLKKLLSLIDNIKDFDDFKEMFLIYSVCLFERMVNQHIQREVEINYDLDIKTINDQILFNLRTEEKLGWLLELISNKNFIKSKVWGEIKPFISARNYFIHYKPEHSDKHKNYTKFLNKESIKRFLDNSSKCYRFLKSSRTEKTRELDNRIERIKHIFDERHRMRNNQQMGISIKNKSKNKTSSSN